MSKTRKICVVTGARSEYGLLYWLLREIDSDPETELQLVVTGMHLSDKFGKTIQVIKDDGWDITAEVPMNVDCESEVELVGAIGSSLGEFARVFDRIKPDIVVVMGDRFELFSIAPACSLLRIPIGHISGGEITEGAIDDQIRHAMTKLSSLHFTANEEFSSRVAQMGEEGWRIFSVGEPGLDFITKLDPISREDLGEDLGLDLSKKTAILTLHSTTHEIDELPKQVEGLYEAIRKTDCQFIITYPNADTGHDLIITKWKKLVEEFPERIVLLKSLGQKRYVSALHYVDFMIGNTSSGIVESPSFGIPVVNIGNRQKGRICAENIINSSFDVDELVDSMKKALSMKRLDIVNPYGDGDSSHKVVSSIKEMFEEKGKDKLLIKKFIDLQPQQ